MIVSGIGRLTKNPDLRYVSNGSAVANLTIAVNDKFKKDHTNYFQCVAFGKTAENISKYFYKGDRIYVMGKLKQESWEKNETKYSTVKISVIGFEFIEKKIEKQQDYASDNEYFGSDDTEDTPF